MRVSSQSYLRRFLAVVGLLLGSLVAAQANAQNFAQAVVPGTAAGQKFSIHAAPTFLGPWQKLGDGSVKDIGANKLALEGVANGKAFLVDLNAKGGGNVSYEVKADGNVWTGTATAQQAGANRIVLKKDGRDEEVIEVSFFEPSFLGIGAKGIELILKKKGQPDIFVHLDY